MADRLYLSLWYPNFRLEALPAALTGVLRQFSLVGGKRVASASAHAIDFTQPPTYQRVYVIDDSAKQELPLDPLEHSDDTGIEAAVAEATEQLHDDMAYEFEMRWQLWALDSPEAALHRVDLNADSDADEEDALYDPNDLWRLQAHSIRVLGFGPRFDVAGFEQNGHVLVDFGLDTPWIMDEPIETAEGEQIEDEDIEEIARQHIQHNVEKLLAFTLLIEKNCGISSRLLWTESGEPLVEKLIARLQRVH